MGQSHHRSFDIEVYAPGADTWLEVSSISWFSDYQARRGNIRFRRHDADGKPRRAPSSCTRSTGRRSPCRGCGRRSSRTTATTTARSTVPEVLRPYMRGIRRIEPTARRPGCADDDPTGSTAERPGVPGHPDPAPTCSATAGCSTRSAGLDVDDLAADPLDQWRRWHDEALDAGVAEPNAMTVATIGADGVPDARIVLARGADERGLVFYTNYEGAKSRQLDAAPVAAAVFAWLDLHRQVRLRARVERVSTPRRAMPTSPSRPRGEPTRRVGVAAERGDRRSGVARRPRDDVDAPLRRRRRPPPGELGRLAADPVRVGVLAGPPEPSPRSPPLPFPRRSADALAHRPPRPREPDRPLPPICGSSFGRPVVSSSGRHI